MNENHRIDDNNSNSDDQSAAEETYHSDMDYEQDNESIDDNEIYFAEKDFQPPAGILYDNAKANDSENEQDDDNVPLLESIPNYDSDDESVPPLEPFPDYESDNDSIVEHLPLLAPAPIVDKHDTQELLATETATVDMTPIPKQDIDYRPEIVIATPRDAQGRNLVFL
jgi:hypothetical protein